MFRGGLGRGRGRIINSSQVRKEMNPRMITEDAENPEERQMLENVGRAETLQMEAEQKMDKSKVTKEFEVEELKMVLVDAFERAGPSHAIGKAFFGKRFKKVRFESSSKIQEAGHRLSPPLKIRENDKVTEDVIGQKGSTSSWMEWLGDMRKVQVARVFDPNEFCLVLEEEIWSHETQKCELLDKFQDEMTKGEWDYLDKKQAFKPKPEMWYAYYDCRQKLWCRVFLLQLFSNAALKIGLVYLIDSKKNQFVPLTSLRVLPAQIEGTLVQIPVFRCLLYDVFPNTSSKNVHRLWPEKVVQYFKECLKPASDKSLFALPMKWSLNDRKKSDRNPFIDLQVVLYSSSKNENLTSINWTMVDRGYAYSKIAA